MDIHFKSHLIYIVLGCRDYIHVMDLADGHVAALRQILDPSYSGLKIYNLGTGRGHTVLEMIKAFSEVTKVFTDICRPRLEI